MFVVPVSCSVLFLLCVCLFGLFACVLLCLCLFFCVCVFACLCVFVCDMMCVCLFIAVCCINHVCCVWSSFVCFVCVCAAVLFCLHGLNASVLASLCV